MSQPTIRKGRTDQLAHGILKKLVHEAGNPYIKLGCKLLEPEIEEICKEEFGPGTRAHEFARRILRVIEGD